VISRERAAAIMNQVFEECRELRAAGQAEYAHEDANALANFEDDARAFGIPREVDLLIFANKHWRGVRAWARGHRSQREDVRGRINDLVVYLCLLRTMVDDDQAGENQTEARLAEAQRIREKIRFESFPVGSRVRIVEQSATNPERTWVGRSVHRLTLWNSYRGWVFEVDGFCKTEPTALSLRRISGGDGPLDRVACHWAPSEVLERVYDDDEAPCSLCKGKGVVIEFSPSGDRNKHDTQVACPRCVGPGGVS
jgi:hypothetical protein